MKQDVPQGRADAVDRLNRLMPSTSRKARRSSLYQAERAPLNSPPEKHRAHATGYVTPLGERLSTAAQRLRYDAVLEAVRHMGKDVKIEEHNAYASCYREQQFAAVRPHTKGIMLIGLAVESSLDERLDTATGKWGSDAITAQFALDVHQPIRGWQLGLLRRAYIAAAPATDA